MVACGMDASMISQMRALEDENRRLKKTYAEMGCVSATPLATA
jgi:hypothetical protein